LLGAILCLRAVLALRAGEPRGTEAAEQGWLRAFSALALCGFYALALVGRAPFWLATFLFVFAFIVGFELWDPEMRERARHRIAAALIIAAAASAVVAYVFQEIFLVRLP
jgi:putative tricarboxylic transport membrane protein